MNTHVALALASTVVCAAFATSLIIEKAMHMRTRRTGEWGRYFAGCILGIAFGLLFIFKYWR